MFEVEPEFVMSSHPDADAFVRVILRDPADVTTRLVFADWLEETGDPSNVAWARFIRLKSDEHCWPLGHPDRGKYDWQLSKHAQGIRAKVHIPAAVFTEHYTSFLDLIPAEQISVRLRGFIPDPEIARLMSIQMVRLYQILPLAWQRPRDTLIVALPLETHRQGAEDFKNLLGLARVIAVLADPEEVRQAILRHWPQLGDDSLEFTQVES